MSSIKDLLEKNPTLNAYNKGVKPSYVAGKSTLPDAHISGTGTSLTPITNTAGASTFDLYDDQKVETILHMDNTKTPLATSMYTKTLPEGITYSPGAGFVVPAPSK